MSDNQHTGTSLRQQMERAEQRGHQQAYRDHQKRQACVAAHRVTVRCVRGVSFMDARVSADGTQATFAAAQVRHDRASNDRFADLVEAVWPIKGAAAVEQYARCPDRTARAYSGGAREPSWKILRDCLRGDEGWPVLKYVMAGSTATWWAVIQQERQLAALARTIFNQLETVMK